MHSSSTEVHENVHVQLRAVIADMNHQLERLLHQANSEEAQKTVAEVMASFAALVKLLALGPVPEVRECPFCKRTVMRAATLCGYCWAKLEPPL
jgi:hypothetical protein